MRVLHIYDLHPFSFPGQQLRIHIRPNTEKPMFGTALIGSIVLLLHITVQAVSRSYFVPTETCA